MTTARDFLDIVPVLDALAVQAGDLPASYLACPDAKEVRFVVESRDEAIAWGKFLGTYDETPTGGGKLIYEARGMVAGHEVSAFHIGEPS